MKLFSAGSIAFTALLFVLPSPLKAQNVLFAEDFENGIGNWQATGLWHAQSASLSCSTPHLPFPSGTQCAWFGSNSTCTFSPQPWDGALTLTSAIPLPATSGSIALRLRSFSEGEDDGVWDVRRTWVSTNGSSWTLLGFTYSNYVVLGSPATPNRWVTQTYDLTPWSGQSIRLRFEFWAGDGWLNDLAGWWLDDVLVEEIAAPGIAYCFGDGTYGRCPCNNYGAAGRGCASSFEPTGARLDAGGFASLSADTLLLSADGVGVGSSFFSQGTIQSNWGVGAVFGDGLKCAGGATIRLGNMIAVGGNSQYPNAGDSSISVKGLISAPGTQRVYQGRYRNASAFCTSETFNTTNGILVTWVP